MVASNPSPQISDELLDFLHHRVNSFIKWDLIRFFHDNPHTKDIAANIAKYVQRDVKTVERELESLVQADALIVEAIDGHTVYALVDDDATREMIASFMEACNDREFRVAAIHHVITGMRLSSGKDSNA